MTDARRLIFIHIPKAAGQTLISIIARQYGPENVATYSGRVGAPDAETRERFPNAKAIVGHLYFGLHQELPDESLYVTFLREPVTRVLSLYDYMRGKSDHYLYDLVREQTLKEFVLNDSAAHETANGQTRQIAGLQEGNPTRDTLEVAKNNLASVFLVTGIVERFDESLLLMSRSLGWKSPYYVQKNVTRQKSDRAHVDHSVRELIQERNELDIELYSFAVDLLNARIAALGLRFRLKRYLFLAANRAAQRYKQSPLSR